MRAITNADGTAPRDGEGNVIFRPDNSRPQLHYEVGYIIAFTDRRGRTRLCKMINLARGLTVLTHGTFSSTD